MNFNTLESPSFLSRKPIGKMGSIAALKQEIYWLSEKSGGSRLLQSLGRHNGRQVYILAYHRVDLPDHRPWLNPELISAAPAQFMQQMALLRRNYQPVTVGEVIEAAGGGKKLPRQAVLVTVDDGYQDFQETILPICSRFNIRPLLFVPTGYVGQGTFWWDKLYQLVYRSGWKDIATAGGERLSIVNPAEKPVVLQRLSQAIKHSDMEHGIGWLDELYNQYLEKGNPDVKGKDAHSTLDWDELRKVSRQGADVAAHTHTHPILSRISADLICQDIRQSKAIIQSELGAALPVFAYPDGIAEAISPEARRIVREEGIQLAFTMLAGRADLEQDPHDYLPRLGTWSKLNLGHFHLRLTPLFSRIQSLRKGKPSK